MKGQTKFGGTLSTWQLRFYIFLLTLGVFLSLAACSYQAVREPRLSYELSQQVYQPELKSSLTLQVQDSNVQFVVIFKGGGGAYDRARLVTSEDWVRIVLFDTDGKLQNMWVNYQLSGSILGLRAGKYKFYVEDSNGKRVAEDTFTIL